MFLTAVHGECQAPVNGEPSPAPESSTSQSASQSPSSEPSAPIALRDRPSVAVSADYRIGAGDILRVSVWQEPQFTTSTVVRPDGKISIPLVSGLAVAGMTPDAAQELLATEVSRFVKHPRVTVIVEEIHSRIVYITGEVQHPGAYPLVSSMNVVQAISRAGGPTEFAKKKEIYILHQNGGLKLKVNYPMVLAGKHLEENYDLIPGDTVVVP